MRRVLFVLTAVAGLVAADARAQSSKAAWRFEELIDLASAAATDGVPASPNDTGWKTILTTHIKTPNAKELAMGVSLQCGLVTDTTVRSKGGDLDSAAAQSRIKVRVKITQPDGTVVFAEPDNGADLEAVLLAKDSGLTYCDRFQKLAARFSGLNCTVDATGAVTCADPEELQLILKTLSAHHFVFLHANAVPGVQTVEVQARAQSAVALGGTSLGAAGAAAFVGAGALSVETIRLVKDADGTTDLGNLN
jgi:hypothetical protein